MAFKYTYTKQPVDIPTLNDEINSSSISSAGFEHIIFNGPSSLIITFDGELSSGDEVVLNTVVNNHTGEPVYDAPGTVAVADGHGGVVFVDVTTVSGVEKFNYLANYVVAHSNSTTNTNSTSYIDKLILNTGDLPDGDYRTSWYFEWKRSQTSNNFEASVTIDNTTDIMEIATEAKDVNNWNVVSGFSVDTLTSGSHSIILKYRGESKNATSYIRRVRLEFWRVA